MITELPQYMRSLKTLNLEQGSQTVVIDTQISHVHIKNSIILEPNVGIYYLSPFETLKIQKISQISIKNNCSLNSIIKDEGYITNNKFDNLYKILPS